MSSFDTDVIIAGAGPTGLMAAALLLRCGVKIRILDKAPAPARESRAFGMQARSLELFHFMGLADEFMDKGLIAVGAQIYVNGKEVAEVNFADLDRTDTPYSFVMMIPQYEVEAILNADIERLGVKVERGLEVVGFEQSVEGVTLQARDAEGKTLTLRSAYVIGADGAHSFIRQKLGLSFEGAAYEQGFMLADAKVDWELNDDHFKIFLHGPHFALYFPLRGEENSRIIATLPQHTQPHDPIEKQGSAPATLEEVEEAFRLAAHRPVSLSNPRWLSRYRVHHRGVNRASKGRAFVAGDAAHIHSPIGAQGMNTGLQDAANLCWKLALVLKGAASNALLDTYHAERWPVGQKLLNVTDRLFIAVSSQAKWVTALRNLAMPLFAQLLAQSRWLRGRAFHFASQLGIRYHGNSFLQDDYLEAAPHRWVQSLAPGMRAPNAVIAHNRDVFGLIKGYGFTVLALSKTPLNEAGLKTLHAELATLPAAVGLPLTAHIVAPSLLGRDPRLQQAERMEVFRTYHLSEAVPQALYFIRPDGHIAYRCDGFDIESLRRFIKERLTGIG